MPGLPLLVGRARERAQAEEVLAGGVPAPFVLLEGEPGIGKTRLLKEVVQAAAERGHTVVFGGAEDGDGAASPFALWRDALRQLGHRLPPGSDGPADERRWEVWEVLDDALAASAEPVVVLEDLHWADEESLWVLRQLVGAAGRTPVLATARPVGADGPRRWLDIRRDASVVSLGPLDRDDVAELLQAAGADPAEAAAVRDRTGGVPLLVHEVLGGAGAGGSAVLAGHLLHLLDAIGPGPAATVRLLALGGSATPVAVVAHARDVPADQVVGEVARAVQVDLLHGADRHVVFRHALLAETLVEQLSPPDRAELHRRLAAAWSAQGGDLTARLAAARHRLAAPAGAEAARVVEDALDVAREAVGAGRATEGRDLADRAATVADDLAPGDVDLRARALVEATEARWVLDDVEGAVGVGLQAVALANQGASTRTQAAAEVAALRHHNPFAPDPVTAARLDRLIEALEADREQDASSGPLLARVLGRRSVLGVSVVEGAGEARGFGDRAIEVAREVGDPELVVGALRDRYYAPATVADFDARGEVAVEVLALARAVGRPDLAAIGHDWILWHRLSHGDLAGAEAALAEMAVGARLMSAPTWRYAELIRRSALQLLRGRFDEGLATSAEARALGDTFLLPEESHGIHYGTLCLAFLLGGIVDPDVAQLIDGLLVLTGTDVPFLQVQQALGLLVAGRMDEAAAGVEGLLRRPEELLAGPEGLTCLVRVAEVAWRTGAPGSDAVRTTLAPFTGRLTAGSGIAAPVDVHLGWLDLLDGNLSSALDLATRAVAFSRGMPSPPSEAHALTLLAATQRAAGDEVAARSARDAAEAIAERLGMTLPAPRWLAEPGPVARRAALAGQEAWLEKDGGTWLARSPHGEGRVADSVGMGQLACLLARPGEEVEAAALAGSGAADAAPVATDLGPALDARAKREYRRRIGELQVEIDEAEAFHDPARADRAQAELDALMQELRRSVGLGGRDRPQGSGNERARVNVTRNLRRAIRAVEAEVPALGAHLAVSVRTGHRCAYVPEPAAALTWHVQV